MANPLLIFHLAGSVVLVTSLAFLLPVPFLAWHGDPTLWCFVKSGAVSLVCGAILAASGWVRRSQELRSRDGLAVVAVSWFLISLLGALPFWFSGRLDVWSSIFESFSGFSSTGATNINDLSTLPKGLLFWRAFTQYVGGMGIIVLMVAVLPFLGVGGQLLMKNELSALSSEKLKPRVAQIAKILWYVYLAFTLVLFILYLFGDLSPFDSLCLTFSTLSTGGFSNWNDSLGRFQGSYVPLVSLVFMTIGSVSFALHYQAFSGRPHAYLRNPELVFFLSLIAVSTLVVASTLRLSGVYDGILTSLYQALFHVTSVVSTSGHSLTDWSKWPRLAVCVLFLLYFFGGCSGSTSGGLKCMRWLILFKSVHRAFRRLIHPRGVFPVRVNGRNVPESVLEGVWLFFLLYFVIFCAAVLLLSAFGLNMLDSLSAAAASMGNVGSALGNLGPSDTYWFIPGPAKGVLSLCMLLGRLEFYSVLLIFVPEFWSR
ncbi:MAG: TrkH family potassium uptake protein [Deltaproteobacteria bacterium]|jgi:trk system potassium uptake protein TrkH|nr:TrkH family potassium uptake protein [Deltaproteobacteria bacterium]